MVEAGALRLLPYTVDLRELCLYTMSRCSTTAYSQMRIYTKLHIFNAPYRIFLAELRESKGVGSWGEGTSEVESCVEDGLESGCMLR